MLFNVDSFSTKTRIRWVLTLALLVCFLYQVGVSFFKYWNPVVTTVTSKEPVDKILFPSFAFCLLAADSNSRYYGTYPDRFEDPISLQHGLDELGPVQENLPVVKQLVPGKGKTINYADPSFYPLGSNVTYEDTWNWKWAGYWDISGCHLFNPMEKVPVGLDVVLNYTKMQTVFLQVYARDNSIESASKKFGIEYISISEPLASIQPGQIESRFYDLLVTKYVSLPSADRPCWDDGTHQGLEFCKERYFLKHMNCTLPWNKERKGVRVCHLNKDVRRYQNLSMTLSIASEKEVIEMLDGCRMPCTFHHHRLFTTGQKVYSEPCQNLPKDVNCNRLLEIQLTINNANLEVITETLLYDSNNLVADVGGLLGLLLGASVLSIYANVANWLERKACKGKKNKKKREENGCSAAVAKSSRLKDLSPFKALFLPLQQPSPVPHSIHPPN